MFIASWNIRGLNDPSKFMEVRRLIKDNNVVVIALFEIRVKKNVKKI